MTQNAEAEINVHDQPLTKTWADDWARAEAQAEDEEKDNAGDARKDSGSSWPSESGASATETSGEQGDGEADAGSQPGEEPSGGEILDDGGQRDASRPGRVRRERVSESLKKEEPDERTAAFMKEGEELGYSFDDRQVTSQERVSLRHERRDMRRKLATERAEVEEMLRKQVGELEERHGKAASLQKAIDADDLGAVAEALGYKDWGDLNTSYLNKTLSPEHKEIAHLKRQMKAQHDREEKATGEETSRREQETRTAKEKEYLADLSDDIGDLAEEHLSGFAKDPAFVSSVLSHQKSNWDGVETISTQEAAALAYKDAKVLFDQLNKYFGSQETVTPEMPASGATTEKTTRRRAPKTVSQKVTAEASQVEDGVEFDDKAWLKKHSKLIDEANRRGTVT